MSTPPGRHVDGFPSVPGTDWEVTALVKVTDGDTLRAFRRRTLSDRVVRAAESLSYREAAELFDDPESAPFGVALRLIILDTPERGQPGYATAKEYLQAWLHLHFAHGLRCETWPGGGFDRLLADVWCAGCGRDVTASQHMLRSGWEPYLGSRYVT